MLAEDMRLLDLSQKTLLLTAQQATWGLCFHWFPSYTKYHEEDMDWCRKTLYMQWVCIMAVILWVWRTQNLSNYLNFSSEEDVIFIILDSKQSCLLFWKKIPYLSYKTVHYTNILKKTVHNKSCWCLLTRCIQAQEIHGKLAPNSELCQFGGTCLQREQILPVNTTGLLLSYKLWYQPRLFVFFEYRDQQAKRGATTLAQKVT